MLLLKGMMTGIQSCIYSIQMPPVTVIGNELKCMSLPYILRQVPSAI